MRLTDRRCRPRSPLSLRFPALSLFDPLLGLHCFLTCCPCFQKNWLGLRRTPHQLCRGCFLSRAIPTSCRVLVSKSAKAEHDLGCSACFPATARTLPPFFQPLSSLTFDRLCRIPHSTRRGLVGLTGFHRPPLRPLPLRFLPDRWGMATIDRASGCCN